MEERCKHKITPRRVIEEETEELDKKPLRDFLSPNDPLVNKIGVHEYKKGLSGLIYPIYLNPPSSNYQQASLSYVFTRYLDLANSSKLHPPINGSFQCFPYTPKLLSTL